MSERQHSSQISRRDLLRIGAVGLAATTLPSSVSAREAGIDVVELSIAEMQQRMSSGNLTSLQLVNAYLDRIDALDQSGPKVNSVIETNPDAREIAKSLDQERASSGPRGPLHGIPILLKDNIDTADQTQTAAGSLALVGQPPLRDATVAKRLRNAGAVLLGKANLSEWANFRGFGSSSGFSGRGRQCNNPNSLRRNPCGSSSGSAAAVAASFCAAALGTETDGSIVCPSSANGVVGIKPTVGLTSRAGVVPISHSQDTVGPHGRTVADAAAVLGALVGVDPRDPATQSSAGHFHKNYTQFLNPDGLRGKRIGIPRSAPLFFQYAPETDAIFEDAVQRMRDAGAIIVDPAEIPTADRLFNDPAELIVLIFEFKVDLNKYLATRKGVPISTLADAIQFNLDHFKEELLFFGQELFEFAEAEIFSEAEYDAALKRSHLLSREKGIDAVLQRRNLDALVAPTGSPAWTTDLILGDHFLGASSYPCAMAGYPIINVNAGYSFGLPVGISFMGTAFSEPKLIEIASGFEAVSVARKPPKLKLESEVSFPQVQPGRSPGRMDRKSLEHAWKSLTFPGSPSLKGRL